VKPQLTIRHRCDSPLVRAMALKSRASDRTRFSRIHGVPTGAPPLFRDRVQFCSGLVDLIECVGDHRGGGHCFALVGERFVGLVAEDIA
jgi:hypothetical protein